MTDTLRAQRIESTQPKSWEKEADFHDALYEWMNRAPWLAISVAAHLLIFFVLVAIPWEQFEEQRVEEFVMLPAPAPVEEFEEPDERIEDETEPQDEDDPVLVEEDPAIDDPSDFELEKGEPLSADAPEFELPLSELGLGSGPLGTGELGKYGERGAGRRGRGTATERALLDALAWLRAHQHPDGYWDADGFADGCGKIGPSTCGGAGAAPHDVGLTGLALLAFLGNGNTTGQGPHRDVVSKGIRWLHAQQDPETGRIGDDATHEFIYDHALATLALCEAYVFSKSPLIKRAAQSAVDYIQRARNPDGAWRYEVPPIGDNDTSVTGWMVFCLVSAKDGGLRVDESAFDAALAWIDEVTDSITGRIGYDQPGSESSRTASNEHFPRSSGEAMTAVGLLCRIFMGERPDDAPILAKHAELLLRTPPHWDPDGFGCDMYYWYYGTYAMYQMGGDHWRAWEAAMKPAVIETQRRDGDEKGSWDPVGPWGYAGGRVYATALMTLCMEVYFRYGRVLGAR